MSPASSRRGFALPVTIVMMAIVAIVVAAVGGFVSHAARQTRVYLARTRCRLAAQSVLEQAKVEIQGGFARYAGGSGAASIKVDPRQADVYDWFDTVSGDRKTIGSPSDKSVTLSSPVNVNGCSVMVAIGRFVEHAAGSPVAIVPVVATAVYRYEDGLEVTSTIQERVVFGTGQSRVFDYAYFVNNYGWMNGSSIVINGDLRANGNVSLSGSTVNGMVYAAANDELNVPGRVTLASSPQIKGLSAYRSSAGDRARPDVGDYDTAGAYDAPSQSGRIRRPDYYSDQYDEDGRWRPIPIPATGTVGGKSGQPILNEGADSLPMPFVSDLDAYVEYAQSYGGGAGGSLTYPGYTYTDAAGALQTVAGGTVRAHYDGTGPSGDAAQADRGALVLVGTAANPIRINGPVVVDSDVIVKGYVKGQGTIYSGRNIHIIGDIRYVDGPEWSHPDGDDAAVEASNAGKDMLGLVAKGNIVVGDSTTAAWMNSMREYIRTEGRQSVVHRYACDPSDANIGYPSTFDGDYTAVEQVSGLSAEMAASAPGGYDASSGQFGKVRTRTVELDTWHEEAVYDRWGRYQGTKQVRDTATESYVAYDRRYYETVCDDRILQSLKDTSGAAQIDAVLYNNHGIFGTPGRSGSDFNLNGSLVCRDEALIFSGNGIRFNWDMRLKPKTGNAVTGNIGLPVGPQDPYVLEWMEIPDHLNAAYVTPSE